MKRKILFTIFAILIIGGCIWLEIFMRQQLSEVKKLLPPDMDAVQGLSNSELLLVKKSSLPRNKNVKVWKDWTKLRDSYSSQNISEFYHIDNTPATFKFEVMSFVKEEAEILNKLYPDYITAIKKAEKLQIPILFSIDLINAKTKQFNDQLYATLEINIQKEIKLDFLKTLLEEVLIYYHKKELTDFEKECIKKAVAYIGVGLKIAEEDLSSLLQELRNNIDSKYKEFMDDRFESKPIGFFTCSEELKKIFTQDRFYQEKFYLEKDIETGAALVIAYVISRNRDLYSSYKKILNFYQRITNPLSTFSMLDYIHYIENDNSIKDFLTIRRIEEIRGKINQTKMHRRLKEKEISECYIGVALFPYSYSKETDLFHPLQSLPGKDLMEYLIRNIENRKIDLKPHKESGWYDYQQYSMEVLLLPERGPESKKLILSDNYRERLKKAFKAVITKTRETHVKQLEIPYLKGGDIIPIEIYPKFRIEPFPTFYLRTAKGYEFVEDLLKEYFPDQKDFYGELVAMKKLMKGLYLLSCEDLGLKPEFKDEVLKDYAQKWLERVGDDESLKKDIRCAIPVFKLTTDPDEPNPPFVSWATIGVKFLKIRVKYDKKPNISSLKNLKVVFNPKEYLIPVEVFCEYTTPRGKEPLDREEFQKFCDKYKAEEAIRTHLGELSVGHKKSAVVVFSIAAILLCSIAVSLWLVRTRKNYKEVVKK